MWLKSVEYNSTIDFLIITDNKNEYDYPKNVRVINMTFDKVKSKFNDYFDFSISLDLPYKLCDYRPFYGEIFKEYVNEYDFYGYCDIDVIFGDIRGFLNNIDLDKYYKVYNHGHFTLIKNDGYIPNLLLNAPRYDDIWDCHEVYSRGDGIFYFDEWNGICPLLNRLQTKQYINFEDIANLDFFRYSFYPLYSSLSDKRLLFQFNHGKIFGITEDFLTKEFLYVHLQKRIMTNNVTNKNNFYIIPNSFIDIGNLNFKNEFEREDKYSAENPTYGEAANIEFYHSGYKTYYLDKQSQLKEFEKELNK